MRTFQTIMVSSKKVEKIFIEGGPFKEPNSSITGDGPRVLLKRGDEGFSSVEVLAVYRIWLRAATVAEYSAIL